MENIGNKIFDINQLVKENNLFFWSNCTGDLFTPGSGLQGNEEEVPAKVMRALMDFWSELRNDNEYVVTFNGKVGLLVSFLLNEDWALVDCGLAACYDNGEALRRMHETTRATAFALKEFFTKLGYPSLNVVYGIASQGDNDDEVGFFVPLDTDEDKESAFTKSFIGDGEHSPFLDDICSGPYVCGGLSNIVYDLAKLGFATADFDNIADKVMEQAKMFATPKQPPILKPIDDGEGKDAPKPYKPVWTDYSYTDSFCDTLLVAQMSPFDMAVQKYVAVVKLADDAYAYESGVINVDEWLAKPMTKALNEVLGAYDFNDLEGFIKETMDTDGSDWVRDENGDVDVAKSDSYIIDYPYLASLILTNNVSRYNLARDSYPEAPSNEILFGATILSVEDAMAMVKLVTGEDITLD